MSNKHLNCRLLPLLSCANFNRLKTTGQLKFLSNMPNNIWFTYQFYIINNDMYQCQCTIFKNLFYILCNTKLELYYHLIYNLLPLSTSILLHLFCIILTSLNILHKTIILNNTHTKIYSWGITKIYFTSRQNKHLVFSKIYFATLNFIPCEHL